jgi:serine protease Do
MVQSALTKTLLTGVIAGVVGGGAILYGQQGVQLLQNQNQKVSTTATSTKTIAKNATATSAYNKVSDAVVSVLNFTKSSQGSYQESSEGSGVIYKKTDGSAFIVTE